MPGTTLRADWLEWRRGGVGASESAAILGVDPFKTRLDVWLDKVSPVKDKGVPSEAAEIGLLVEPAIAKLYERRSGRVIVAQQIRATMRGSPRICATPDGIDDTGELVEFKAIGFPHSELLGEPGTDEVPAWWIIQAQHQMLATGKRAVNFAVLKHGREYAAYRVEQDPDLQDLIRDQVETFWVRHVETRTAPDLELPADARHLARIFNRCEGDVVLTDEMGTLAAEWDELVRHGRNAQQAANAAKEAADLVRARLLATLGNARFAALPDGRMLERAIRTRKEHVVKESTWVELKLRTPKRTGETR